MRALNAEKIAQFKKQNNSNINVNKEKEENEIKKEEGDNEEGDNQQQISDDDINKKENLDITEGENFNTYTLYDHSVVDPDSTYFGLGSNFWLFFFQIVFPGNTPVKAW